MEEFVNTRRRRRRRKASDGEEEEASRVRILCLQEEAGSMEKFSFPHSRNALHMAAKYGQTTSVTKVLEVNPRLALVRDALGSSPLHIAAENGNVDICVKLLEVAPETCCWKNLHGMTPLLVAERGTHVEICQVLTLHEIKEHAARQHSPFHDVGLMPSVLRLTNELMVLPSNEVKVTTNSIRSPCSSCGLLVGLIDYAKSQHKLTVLVGLAAMALQLLRNPPGGRWLEDTSSHEAGDAILASTRPDIYKFFVFTTSIAFGSALLAIFLFTIRSNFLRRTASSAMWVSLIAIAMSYVGSTMAIAPHTNSISVDPIVLIAVMLVSITITLLISAFYPLILFYLGRGRNIPLEEDIKIGHLPKRILYQILRLLDALVLLSDSLLKSLREFVLALAKPFPL